ncbi:5-formyltetrahydrofolate cyclo-ligase [Nocardioides sp. MH1]|uniref:5-formyltetrahydrofolate cyclo-ligase n=1 Tax=Nocardioides sp. MH1 TaxID=3242490 RepID=UPI003522D378
MPSPQSCPEPGGNTGLAKLALRDQLLTARRRRPLTDVGADARSIAGHVLAATEVRRSATVACYVSVGTEPGTSELLDRLVGAGKRVVLPVLLPDNDLDWSVYRGPSSLAPAGRGLLEPAGERLGPDAIATADVVLLPGMAVSPDGMRLGRGGGSYDRALARVPVGTFTCVLLYADELGQDVPAEPHDRRVSAAATPDGVTRFTTG